MPFVQPLLNSLSLSTSHLLLLKHITETPLTALFLPLLPPHLYHHHHHHHDCLPQPYKHNPLASTTITTTTTTITTTTTTTVFLTSYKHNPLVSTTTITTTKGYRENPMARRHHSMLRLTSALGGATAINTCRNTKRMN
ncbi:hypothetical protein E2C01_099448 [Portunus trituberculatus]|uniref:Uncharacterized protein n=1 Tax=Portunus trituberculatus TaxID=210409 RepID=A0A5B7KAT3_PORTR|nr:hypothetical protein [Portunus trituberculatus]